MNVTDPVEMAMLATKVFDKPVVRSLVALAVEFIMDIVEESI
jgi:hypothetical protein